MGTMDVAVQQRLLDINHQFYDGFARQFADSRSTGQASLRRALADIVDGESVLDAGCGDGRAARALDEMGRRVRYLGIDGSASFVALARQRAEGLTDVIANFAVLDVTSPGWSMVLPLRPFDTVLSLAVLHHLPGRALRQRMVSDMAALLAENGRLIVSTWQFMGSERLRKKIVPWAAVGLSESDVEAGDYLLDWQRGGHGLRYCHHIGEDEARDLCTGAGLAVTEWFLAVNGLNLYMVGERSRGWLA